MEQQGQMVAWLTSSQGVKTAVCGTCVLGRAANSTIVLMGEKVSRRHAMVHAQGQDEYWLVDLGSANGTYLNARRVSQPCRLSDGDELKIADHALTFSHPSQVRLAGVASAGSEKTIQVIESRNCWLLVADIEASTVITQRLPVDEAPRVTGRWLAACKQVVDDNHGAINKFLGDGFFAYWDRDETEAVVARTVRELNTMQQSGDPRFRLVLHYGKVFVGGGASMGEESLLGNEVNFAFRMEKLAKLIGQSVLLSEAAAAKLGPILPGVIEAGKHAVPSFEGEYLFFCL